MNTGSPAPEPRGLGGWEGLSWSPRANVPQGGKRQSLRPPCKGQKDSPERQRLARGHTAVPPLAQSLPRRRGGAETAVPQASPLTLGPSTLLSLKGQNEVDVLAEREISRPGRAEAGDKRIRLGWKVTWFWSGFVGGGGVEGWWGAGVVVWRMGPHGRRHSGLREQLRQRGGEDRQAWGKLGMKQGHEPLRLQGPPR